MKKSTLMLSIAVLGIAVVHAKTVAWYRFDDQAVGTKTQGGVAVTNCVDGSCPVLFQAEQGY